MSLKASEHELSSNIMASKIAYESKLVSDFASKESNRIYKYLRLFTKQSSLPSSPHLDTKSESSSLGVATIFNQFFQSVFNPATDSPSDDQHPNPAMVQSSTLSNIEITLNDVYKSLYSLNTSKAMGIDNIHNYILKQCCSSCIIPTYSPPLHHVSPPFLPTNWVAYPQDNTNLQIWWHIFGKELQTYFSALLHFQSSGTHCLRQGLRARLPPHLWKSIWLHEAQIYCTTTQVLRPDSRRHL